MEYLITIHDDESAWKNATKAEFDHEMDLHRAFAAKAAELGVTILESRALQDTSTAITIRGGVATDGPFLETKEAFGGFYLIDAPSPEIALELAHVCPSTKGGVELRPIWDMSDL